MGITRTWKAVGGVDEGHFALAQELRSWWNGRAHPFAPSTIQSDALDWDREIARCGTRVHVALLAAGCPVDLAREVAHDAWLRIIAKEEAGELTEIKLPQLVIKQALFMFRDRARKYARRQQCAEQHVHDGDLGIARLLAGQNGGGHGDFSEQDGRWEAKLDAKNNLKKIEQFLKRSPQTVQRIFVGTFGPEALSAGELATELGITTQRVRQILFETRKQLRDEIQRSIDHAR